MKTTHRPARAGHRFWRLLLLATFLASGGQTIVHPEPARFFELPISVLPEDFGYIP